MENEDLNLIENKSSKECCGYLTIKIQEQLKAFQILNSLNTKLGSDVFITSLEAIVGIANEEEILKESIDENEFCDEPTVKQLNSIKIEDKKDGARKLRVKNGQLNTVDNTKDKQEKIKGDEEWTLSQDLNPQKLEMKKRPRGRPRKLNQRHDTKTSGVKAAKKKFQLRVKNRSFIKKGEFKNLAHKIIDGTKPISRQDVKSQIRKIAKTKSTCDYTEWPKMAKSSNRKMTCQCVLCGKLFQTASFAAYHIRRVHYRQNRKPCPDCHLDFSNNQNLNRHYNRFHGTDLTDEEDFN